MNNIKFVTFNNVNIEDLLQVLNEPALRKHLIDHEIFNSNSIKKWIKAKLEIDSAAGCCIRAIYIDEELAGWCGIQPDDHGYELAIVIASKFWGVGISVFKTLMCWAKDLKHQEVLFHLLDSRPEYKALSRLSTKVKKTTLLGRSFSTYYISVDKWNRH
jgi:hypothetical protein